MYPLYKDLRTRLGKPLWIDQHGVPRYDEFTPQDAAEIYNDFVLVMDVKCQSCGKMFKCVTSIAKHSLWLKSTPVEPTTKNILSHLFGWGDAPWHTQHGDEDDFNGQCAGTAMSTDYVASEFWVRGKSREWIQMEIPKEYTEWQ